MHLDKLTLEDVQKLWHLSQNFENKDLIHEMIITLLRLMDDHPDRGDLKIINSALRELRYSFKIFGNFRSIKKISIFGSARTPENSPDYKMAIEFSRRLAHEHHWMVITGAASGIMKAGNEGAGRDKSFGANIRLPFEQKANDVIENDPKLINFKCFCTRKLIFIKESDAIALFPGGFGTLDEGFEALTLIQTGKSMPRPVVMIATAENNYWSDWLTNIKNNLLKKNLISEEDMSLFKITHSIEEAIDEITTFYRVYHSSRFVRDKFVIRLNTPIPEKKLKDINLGFSDILDSGQFEMTNALDDESNEPDIAHLKRLFFDFDSKSWGRLRSLINFINEPKS